MTDTISDPLTPRELFSGNFDDFALPQTLMVGLTDLGYTSPTFVQREVFAPIKSGRDLVVQSHTGSGKTTAFCLPMLSQVDPLKNSPQALVLAPTRELARQVAVECGRLGHHHGVRVAAIYGGASFEAQTAALRAGAQVVVGTPGRVKDLIERRILDVSQVKVAVLDEADEMLSMGFWEDVTFLLRQFPVTKQTLLFSATIPPVIESALNTLLKDPLWINLSTDHLSAQTVRHVVHIEDESQPKSRNLLYALELHHPKHAVIFCNTRDETDLLERYLRRFGFHVRALHGDMSQSARERVMADVKAGTLDMIIATDIAARGIDISGLTHVFNYELPENDEVYIHRTGRTGRIGSAGTAVSLVRGKDMTQLANVRTKFEIAIEEIALPPEKELLWMQAQRLALLLTEESDGVEVSQYRPVAEAMLGRGDISELLAFLLRSYYARNAEPSKPAEREAPKFEKKPREREQKPKAREPRREPRQEEHKAAAEETPPTAPRKPVIILAKDMPKPPPEPESALEAEEDMSEDASSYEAAPIEDDEPRSDFTRLYITLGRHDGFADLTALAHYLSLTTGVDLGHFTGMGHVRDTSSHVEVDAEVAEQIIRAINGRPRKSGQQPSETGETIPTILCEVAKGMDQPQRRRFRGRR